MAEHISFSRTMCAASLVVGVTMAAVMAQSQQMPPAWPYVLPPLGPGAAPRAARVRAATPATPRPATTPAAPRAGATPSAAPMDVNAPLVQAAGSARRYPQSQINDSFDPPDWFPDEHPAMPDIVAHGKAPSVRACATCHLADGRGKPENAPLQGLPIDAFISQIRDFQMDLRQSADPRKSNTATMASYAKAMTETDVREAAAYFNAIKVSRALRIVESDTAPVTKIEAQVYVASGDGKTEPTGPRVVEISEDPEQLAIRNPKTSFVAYVPVGSISRGKALATTGGNGKTLPCALCHGAQFEGVGPSPNLAGRSPTYLARQLYDIKLGARHGTLAALMNPVVVNLTDADIVDLAVYMASVAPQ